jgi:ribosomal protein S18 acetylase RimI-like enzyme
VRTLWIGEDRRGQGLGERLVATAEREAARRGCHEVHVVSHSYQAPGFYRRLGYTQIGELPGWLGNATRLLFRKKL